MEENLLGYLIKALDPVSQREVEEHLRSDPEARRLLELLRSALTPLAEEKSAVEPPPPGLRYATLARVAEYRCRNLPYAPSPPARATIPIRSWWRWPDALVAAAILLITVSLVPLVRYRVLHNFNVTACKNNLAHYSQALVAYADHHNGYLPKLKAGVPPEDVAGVFVPILIENGLLSRDVSTMCPSNGHRPPPVASLSELLELYRERPDEFEKRVRTMSGCYAYVLGYRDKDGNLHGIRRGPNNDRFPILADRPPFDQDSLIELGRNSWNHGGQGQNVLFLDGHIEFCTSRKVGPDGDDIFTNWYNQVDAGVHAQDAVLGASSVRVRPVAWVRD